MLFAERGNTKVERLAPKPLSLRMSPLILCDSCETFHGPERVVVAVAQNASLDYQGLSNEPLRFALLAFVPEKARQISHRRQRRRMFPSQGATQNCERFSGALLRLRVAPSRS